MNISKITKVGVIVILGAGLLLGGCASQDPGRPRTLNQLVNDGDGPEWLVKGGKAFSGDKRAFYGIGSAGRIRNPALMRRSAQAQARRDIASQFKVYIAALNKQYTADITAGDGDAHSEEQAVTDTLKELTDATLQGVTIEEYWLVRVFGLPESRVWVSQDYDGATFDLDDGSTIDVPFFHVQRNLLFADGHVGGFSLR